jgi:hypothetical protein
MEERLIRIHLVETAEWPEQRLFEVAVRVTEGQRLRLKNGDHRQWRATIEQARQAIRAHGGRMAA